MSALPVISYLGGIIVFGMAYYFLSPVFDAVKTVSESGASYMLINALWVGLLLIYLIFGGYYMISRYNEESYGGGMR